MKADPSAQLRLLDVAALDARLDLLRHKLGSLPEHAQIAEIDSQHQAQQNRVRDAQILVEDLTRDQKKADQDVEQVKGRRERDRQRMDAGVITNPKDLERMTHELESLERRISDLEDVELEVMEHLEAAQAELSRATEELEVTAKRRAELVAVRDEKTAGIEEQLATAAAQRGDLAGEIPEDLRALYEKIRTQKGIGAAELRAKQCGGCQLSLNASDLSVIAKAPADEVVRCEECARILVRTAESGL